MPDSGADRAPLSAANAALDPAVVNHVRRTGAVDGSAEPQATQESKKPAPDSSDPEVRRLQARDAEVRAHERAHAAAGGGLAGAPSYQFERGPDGRSYAVAGEVSIDISDVSDNPQATVQKMMQVKRAALAPQSPSDADRAIAAMADAKIAAARVELNTSAKDQPEVQPAAQAANAPKTGDAAHAAFGAYEQRNAAAAAYETASRPVQANAINIVS